MNPDALPENTPGIFLEHFDVAPNRVTNEQILTAARHVAGERGWGFRSYSSGEWPANNQDFIARRVVSYPALVVFLDGEEAGRIHVNEMSPDLISQWVDQVVAYKRSQDSGIRFTEVSD